MQKKGFYNPFFCLTFLRSIAKSIYPYYFSLLNLTTMSVQRLPQAVLCILLLAHFSVTHAQKNTRPKPAPELTPDTVISSADTLPIRAMDSVQIATHPAQNTTVLLLKETPGKDNMKYVFPILTLLLGILVNRVIDYFSQHKRVSRTGRRWKAELTLMESPIQQQIDSLDTFVKELNKDVYDIPKLSIFPSLKGDVFRSLDKSELLSYIQRKSRNYTEAVKKANKVVGTVDILTNHYDVLKEKFNEFLAKTSQCNQELTEHLQHLLRSFSQYGTAVEKQHGGANPLSDDGYRSLHDLFDAHIYPKQDTGDYDIYELKDRFFIPLIEALGHLRHDDRTLDIQDHATACLNTIHAIKAEKGYMVHNAGIIKERYEASLKELPDILKKMP
ncbi:MAG: hypothetical protein J0I32_23195 [Sphingobacteriales bacterium]|nr:hypothetical protein [Sphingobacteriales bacterium]